MLDAELDGNSVGAYVFPIRDQAPLLEITYDVKDGDTLRLESSEFAAVSADDATIGWAKANLLLNPLMPGEEPKLGKLPTELQCDRSVRGGDFPSNNKTYYRVVLSFDQHLPDQFDLHTPDAWL